MKGVQCYELFGGIALKNHAFSTCFIKRISDKIDSLIHLSQAAYRKERSTTEHVFAMKILCEKAMTSRDYSTHILLLDMTNAFDTIDREHLYKLLSDVLVPDELNIMSILLIDETQQVRNNKTKGQTVTKTLGIPLGDWLSAILFTLYLSNTLSAKIPTHLYDHNYHSAYNMFLTPIEHLHDRNYCIKHDKNTIAGYMCTSGRCNRQSEFTLLHFMIFQCFCVLLLRYLDNNLN